MNERLFNFRHVAHVLGIPLVTETDWGLGHMLAAFARSRGIEPQRILTEKTNPNPSVSAPHIIAHYPMGIFLDAVEHVRSQVKEQGRQLTMFDPEANIVDSGN